MSLIYTEGHLYSEEIGSSQVKLESNIKNILIVPPKDNNIDIKVTIYEYSPMNALYELHLLDKEIFLEGNKFKKDVNYYIQASPSNIQLYYEKEAYN